ncbi:MULTISPECIES: hypothetical protein [Pseudomonas]|jgi:hypothetical protein|nr:MULTISPECIES: hypothetical protein [Pseudomonas]MCF1253229.1 hypothetical protein [Pseudomonas putida]MDN5521301.1 hypothetical protein [Pseudomonas sp.]MDN5532459.1 hypothetical protein [Pseudomonas sp.]PNG86203.1 hypothetical protein CBL13_00027 [Pseudomonas putida]
MLNAQGWFTKLRTWLKVMVRSSDGRRGLSIDKTPRVPQMLENVPGGQMNLLPVSALKDPLRVEVPMWPNSNPDLGPETLTLFWNTDVVEQRTFTVPVTDADLIMHVPANRLGEGEPVLKYQVKIFNGVPEDSDPLMLTIDRQAPILASDNKVQPPPEVVSGGVTVVYLEQNGDELLATLPAYDTPQVGDRISYYWDRQLGSDELVDVLSLTQADVAAGTLPKLKYGGEMIRERGDGPRFLHYRVDDRAGNQSAASALLQLTVAATPAPRTLSWPELPAAEGKDETIVLETGSVEEDLEAWIPEDAGVGSLEPVQMQWGEPGQVGAVTIQGAPGTRRFLVPLKHVPAHSGKTIPLYYLASGDVSTRRQVRLTVFRPSAPGPQIEEAGTQYLSLRDIGEGVHVTQVAWGLISTDQRVTIRAFAYDAQSQLQEHIVLDQHAVTEPEMLDGFGQGGTLILPRSFFDTLKADITFFVWTTVSLDGGQTWPESGSFRTSLTLVP